MLCAKNQPNSITQSKKLWVKGWGDGVLCPPASSPSFSTVNVYQIGGPE